MTLCAHRHTHPSLGDPPCSRVELFPPVSQRFSPRWRLSLHVWRTRPLWPDQYPSSRLENTISLNLGDVLLTTPHRKSTETMICTHRLSTLPSFVRSFLVINILLILGAKIQENVPTLQLQLCQPLEVTDLRCVRKPWGACATEVTKVYVLRELRWTKMRNMFWRTCTCGLLLLVQWNIFSFTAWCSQTSEAVRTDVANSLSHFGVRFDDVVDFNMTKKLFQVLLNRTVFTNNFSNLHVCDIFPIFFQTTSTLLPFQLQWPMQPFRIFFLLVELFQNVTYFRAISIFVFHDTMVLVTTLHCVLDNVVWNFAFSQIYLLKCVTLISPNRLRENHHRQWLFLQTLANLHLFFCMHRQPHCDVPCVLLWLVHLFLWNTCGWQQSPEGCDLCTFPELLLLSWLSWWFLSVCLHWQPVSVPNLWRPSWHTKWILVESRANSSAW